jgi:RimJ/RimL family protein N-acetyltransferase
MDLAGETPPVVTMAGERVALGPPRRDLVPLYGRWVNDFARPSTLGDLPRPRTAAEVTAHCESSAAATEGAQFTINKRVSGGPSAPPRCGASSSASGRRSSCSSSARRTRGRGLGAEVTRLLLDYAFTALGLHSAMLTVAEFNLAGRRAYERAGAASAAAGGRASCWAAGCATRSTWTA